VFYGEYVLNASEYFVDPENEVLSFDSKNIGNISIEINGETVTYRSTIIGNYEAYIYAMDSEHLVRSNTFWINITNETINITPINETLNLTLVNETINITPVNESLNLTLVNQTTNLTANITNETLIQFPAEIGKPVKWLRQIKFDENKTNLSIKIHKKAHNITLYKKIKEKKQNITKVKTKKEINITELIIEEPVQELEIEYFTEAPQVLEQQISEYRKQITVSSGEHYQNILAYTDIPELTHKKHSIMLYWLKNNTRLKVQNVTYLDENNNGLIDRIKWIVPHLSNETYEVDITIINVQSYPTVGGTWSVLFNTTGEANLTIKAVQGTTWSNVNENEDLKFLQIQCGDQTLSYDWINDSVFIENYTCAETGNETSKVLTPGKHTLEFRFGEDVEYAYNRASPFWLVGWDYRKELNITNTYDDLTEYQILVYLDTNTPVTAGKMNDDCSDIRITDEYNNTLPHYIEETPGHDCNESDTLIWVQIDDLTNDTTERFFIYYGNSGASDTSDMAEVFNYTSLKSIYYTVGENVYDGTIGLVAFLNNTNVTWSGSKPGSGILSEGEFGDLTTGQYGGTGASVLQVTGPIFGGDNLSTEGAEFNPISWSSTEFVVSNGRGAYDIYFYSHFATINITCYEAVSEAGTWGTYDESVICNKESPCSATTFGWTAGRSIYCNSSHPFLMYAQTTAAQFPVYPLADDMWAISDSLTSLATNNTRIESFGSDGSSGNSSRTIGYRIAKGDGADGSGLAWHFRADEAGISTNEYADGDGGENAQYRPEFELEKNYYFYKAGDYVALAATRNDTNCSLYASTGYSNQTNRSNGSLDYPYPSKNCFGCGADVQIWAVGARVFCNNTVGGHWETTGNDESTLFGMKAARQYVYPEPSYVLGAEESRTEFKTPPNIAWEDPTPDDEASVGRDYVYLNTTVTDVENTSAFFDWNFTLRGYWAMDFYDATNILDNSTNSNDALFVNGIGTSDLTTGKYGLGLEFNRAESHLLQAAYTEDFNITKEVTVEAWVKVNDNTNTLGIFRKNNAFAMRRDSAAAGTDFAFFIYNGTAWEPRAQTSDATTIGEWYHVVGTYDPDGGSNNLKIYVNGVLEASTTRIGDININSNVVQIGRFTGDMNGTIDEVRLYSRALTPEEINASYNNNDWRLYHNFTSLTDGETYNYSAYAIDENGNLNFTTSRSVTVAVPTDKRFKIRNTTGDVVASIDEEGDMFIRGGITVQAKTPSCASCFLVKNRTTSRVAQIEVDGSVAILGELTQEKTSWLAADVYKTLHIQDSSGNTRAVIDPAGNLKLGGTLYENHDDP
jgi:hypothetical protein